MGHYGSGKTHAAINWALALRAAGHKTVSADLDIVNPYFRTKDSKRVLDQNDIALISSPFAGSNVDLPALPQEMYAIVDEIDTHFVVDVGGDDRGALALGRLSDRLKEENDYEALFVLNLYRPLTRTAQDALSVLREVEAAGGLPVTGIVNCSNLGEETTRETVLASAREAEKLAKLSGLPIRCTAVLAPLCDEMRGELDCIFPMRHHQAHY
jgi:hypothetical protein